MSRPSKAVLCVTATGALVLGSIAIPALAQQDARTGTEAAADDRVLARSAHREAFVAALADELGLDVQTVEDAVDAVREDLREQRHAKWRTELEERLDAAVADGSLSQSDADLVLAMFDDDTLRDVRDARRGARGDGIEGHLDAAVADGLLTRAEADALLAAHEANVLPGHRGQAIGPGRDGPGRRGGAHRAFGGDHPVFEGGAAA